MAIDRTKYNALIDDDGSNTVGTVWNKQQIKDVILDPVDAALVATPPAAHHLTHETGGSDVITKIDGASITTGTVPDARLSANVPRLNAINTFTAGQMQSGAPPTLDWINTAQAVGSKALRIINNGTSSLIYSMNETNGAAAGGTPNLMLDRNANVQVGADIYEKGRATPMGHWINYPWAASNFTAFGGATWTVESGDVIALRYTVIGKTLVLQIFLTATSLSVASPYLYITMPGGFTAATATSGINAMVASEGSTYIPSAWCQGQANLIILRRDLVGGAWTAGTNNLSFAGTAIVDIQ